MRFNINISLIFASSFAVSPVQAQVRLTETGGSTEYISLQAPLSLASNISWLFPATDGSANQCLSTNGSGTLQWRTPTGNSFALDASDGSPVNALYVTATGNVGIGITTPITGAILDLTGAGTTGSAVIVPRDTTANRPTGVNGMIRYNTSTNSLEGYQEGAWTNFKNGLMGKLEWAGTNNCWWPNAAGSTWSDIPADANCPNPTVTGGATAPGTKIPAITIANLPPGAYEVTLSSQLYNFNGAACRWRISDGSTNSGMMISSSSAITESQPNLVGLFVYTTTATRTFRIQGYASTSAAGSCYVTNDEPAYWNSSMWVKGL